MFFASLPKGKAVVYEELLALDDITVTRVEQGRLSIMNDGYFAEHEDLRGRRTLYWEGGEQMFVGYVIDSTDEDVLLDLAGASWVNVDDRFGLVFEATGRALYHNQHHFEVWHATEDTLVLGRTDEPHEFRTGERIARLLALWCPGQTHEETGRERLQKHSQPANGIEVRVDDILCVCDFERETVAFC